MVQNTPERVAEARKFIDETFGEEVELHEDLQLYRRQTEIGPCIQHPLVYSIMHHDRQNGMVNKQLEAKRKQVEEAIQHAQWKRAVFLYERPWRLETFMQLAEKVDMKDSEYWEILGSIWTDSENIFENQGDWRDALTEDRPGKGHLMSNEELTALGALPERIQIYRGFCGEGGEDGLSWTLDLMQAHWFAKRFAKAQSETAYAATGYVDLVNIIAYFKGRNEAEIVVLPEDVENITIEEVK